MKDFFKFMFASMLGFFLVCIIMFFLSMAVVMMILSIAQPKQVTVNDKSILHLKLDYDIADRSSNDPFQFYWDLSALKPKPGLKTIKENIEKAKNDDRIKGIYLDLANVPSGLATIDEIREALLDFKSSGKFIYAYGDIYLQKAFYLATTADKIFLNPEGFIEFRGFEAKITFIKGLLDKIGVEPQVIRHGKFKSAVEPLISDHMSDANREQTKAFIQSMWDNSLRGISSARNIGTPQLNLIADSLLAQTPESAYALKIVDSLIYFDEFLSILANEIGVDHVKSNNLISVSNYDEVSVNKNGKRSKNKLAVIYASGDIVQGEGSDNTIGSDKIARTIRQARLDDKIKAVVFRVNSPGGDGLASDVILREISLTKLVKPVVVSMGNYAASGGYYISCGADKIVADASTITGSIGVFGIIPNFKEMFNEKLGITFDGTGTNKNSDYISVTQPLSDYQHAVIKGEIERFYATFVNHVAEGRKMTFSQVDSIAQGRVWSGIDAMNLGLVDELGGLDKAIAIAVDLAGLTDYRTVDLPEQKQPIEQIIEDIFGETKTKILQDELGENYQYYSYLKSLMKETGIQARLPYQITIN